MKNTTRRPQNTTTDNPAAPLLLSTIANRKSGIAGSAAFTLMEILIVVAIIGLLVGLAVSNLGGIFSGAQTDTAKTFVSTSIEVPLLNYRMHVGDYPSTSEGLQALVTAPAGKEASWRGPYLKSSGTLIDPWKEPYVYRYPGTNNKTGYDIFSKGPDKTEGTADDIGNWDTSAAQ